MKRFFAMFHQYDWLKGAFYLILGVFIMWQPGKTINSVINIFSLYFIVMGLISIIQGYRYKEEITYAQMSTRGGIMYLILGGVIFFFARALVSMLPFMLGIFIVSNGIMKLIGLNKLPIRTTGAMVYNVVLIILGFILLMNPFGTILVLFRFFGAILFAMGINELWSYTLYR